eukprot:347565_1
MIFGIRKAVTRAKHKRDERQDDEKYDLEKQSKLKRKTEALTSLTGQLKLSRRILETYINPNKETKGIINNAKKTVSDAIKSPDSKLIPKQIIQNAKGIIFLRIHKTGILVGKNFGTGCIIIRNPVTHEWSYPISIGILAITHGIYSGGSYKHKDYLYTINSDAVINKLLNNNKIKLGDDKANISISAGPLGRDTKTKTKPVLETKTDTETLSDLFAYPNDKYNGHTVKVNTGTNDSFYGGKGLNTKDILFGNKGINMPENGHYERMIYLLNTYDLDHAFPQNMEEKVDVQKVIKTVDINIENSVNILHKIFNDIDKNVIEVILIEQSWGDMNNAVDILLKMSKVQVDKNSAYEIIKQANSDLNDKGGDLTFSETKLKILVKSNTQKHFELSDEESEEEGHENQKQNMEPPKLETSNSKVLLDNLLGSFDK